jgi:hypothetical protein
MTQLRNNEVRHPLRLQLVFVGVCLFIVAGCNDREPAYPARGIVRFADGAPVGGGWVTCESTSGSRPITARGDLDSQGKFELTTYEPGDGAIAGTYRVAIGVANRDDPLQTTPDPPVASKYQSFETSGIEIVVTPSADKNNFQIQIERAPDGTFRKHHRPAMVVRVINSTVDSRVLN